jgi:hypothetical protein
MHAYLSSQPPGIRHPASPLVDFITTIIKENHSMYQAVLNSGFLDVLVCMYICNFSSEICRVDEVEGALHSIIEVVSAALLMLCSQPNAQAVVSAHPICILWPKDKRLPTFIGNRSAERQAMWRRLGPVIVARRLASLRASLQSPRGTNIIHLADLSDARIDLEEFSRQVHLYRTLPF